MGVTLNRWLLPLPRSRTPSPADLSRLIGRLVDDGFLLRSGSPCLSSMREYEYSPLHELARTMGCYAQFRREPLRAFSCPPSDADLAVVADRDFRLVWPVVSLGLSGLRYPLTRLPESADPDEAYYDIELHWGLDPIYRTSEVIDPFKSEACVSCGRSLLVSHDEDPADFRIFGSQLHRSCPNCGEVFRPEDRIATVRDPGGRRPARSIPGGATSCFALNIESGRCYEYEAAPIEPFLTACEEALGFPLETILDGTF